MIQFNFKERMFDSNLNNRKKQKDIEKEAMINNKNVC